MTRRPHSLARRLLLALPVFASVSCGDAPPEASEGRGSVVVAVAADADFLLPAVISQLVSKQVVDQLFEPLAAPPASMLTIGDDGFQPRLAQRWQWAADSMSITFALDPRARWHDGRPVTSRDVRFSIDLIKDPVVASRQAAGLTTVDSASTPDSLTAIVWFSRRTPEQFFSLVYNLPVMPEHLLSGVARDKLRNSEFARQPVGNGRFRFKRWVPGSLIEVVADTTNFRGRPSVDRLIWSVSPDPTSLWARLLTEEADVVELLRGEAVAKVAASTVVRAVPYQGLDFGLALFNVRGTGDRRQPHHVLGDVAVRRALAQAVDRQAVVKNVFDTLSFLSIGPVVRAQWTADTSIAMLPFDPAAARAQLDSAGWRVNGADGIRSKGGKPLAFAILAPSSSAPRRQAAVLLQAQWKAVGADVTIEELEFNAFVSRIESGKFDVVMHALHNDPSPADVRANFGSPTSTGDAGVNYGGYASAVVDAALDSAAVEFNAVRSKALYQRAYAQIIGDAAAVFLYEPRMVAGIHRRIETGPLPAAGWWTAMGDWTIAKDRRVARDRVPLGASAPNVTAASPAAATCPTPGRCTS